MSSKSLRCGHDRPFSQELLDEIQKLRMEVAALKAEQQEMALRLNTSIKRTSYISNTQDEIAEKLDEHAEALNRVWNGLRQRPASPGQKTEARIAKMKAILANGARTFQEMERLLNISPKEMNRLVARLDQRSFVIFTRPGDDRQKVIKLRSLTSGCQMSNVSQGGR